MRLVAVLAAASALVFGGCGFSLETRLQASGRIQSAVVKTFGWTSSDLQQDIDVVLAPQVALADVVDMSVFGRFVPGGTYDDAIRLMGPPARLSTDEWAEPWHVYDLPKATVEVGCQYYSSGGTPSGCSWTLHAIPKAEPTSVLIEPQLHDYLSQAVGLGHRVSIRQLEIVTADRQQRVQLFVKSRIGPGMYWTDRSRSAQRQTAPRGRPTRR